MSNRTFHVMARLNVVVRDDGLTTEDVAIVVSNHLLRLNGSLLGDRYQITVVDQEIPLCVEGKS